MIDKRHGGAYDRGSADAYYGRGFDPHYYEGDTYSSKRVEIKDEMSPEYSAYRLGYDECVDFKNWN